MLDIDPTDESQQGSDCHIGGESAERDGDEAQRAFLPAFRVAASELPGDSRSGQNLDGGVQAGSDQRSGRHYRPGNDRDDSLDQVVPDRRGDDPANAALEDEFSCASDEGRGGGHVQVQPSPAQQLRQVVAIQRIRTGVGCPAGHHHDRVMTDRACGDSIGELSRTSEVEADHG